MGFLTALALTLTVFACCHAGTIDENIRASFSNGEAGEATTHYSNGNVRTEYDIMYTQEQWAQLQQAHADSRSKRKAIMPESFRWKDKIIPYAFKPSTYYKDEINAINVAMKSWEFYTCLKFEHKVGSTKNFLYIFMGDGCWSHVGEAGGQQWLSLAWNCIYHPTMVHEFGHAIGMQHEQTRTDRDDYVTVLLENVSPNMQYNYDRYTKEELYDYNIKYDYSSVMHYGQYAFSRNNEITMITKDPEWQDKIGMAYGQSFADLKLANIMYNCGEECEDKQCPEGAYLDKECRCMCPGNPVKECGSDEILQDPNCVNTHANCGHWADWGECEANPKYMLTACARACGVCKGEYPFECEDQDDRCDMWANQWTECYNNPNWMRDNCPRSCRVCVS